MMLYDYFDRHMWIEDLAHTEVPSYSMCTDHASRLSPPKGWKLTDRRQAVRLFAPLEVA